MITRLLANYKGFIYLSIFVCCFGYVGVLDIPVTLYPAVESPSIRAEVSFEGSTKTFQERWGKKVESSLRAINGVESIEARYFQLKAIYYVNFSWGVDSQIAKNSVEMVTSFHRSRMPDYWPDVFIYDYNPGTENYLAIKHDSLSDYELSRYIKANLLPQIDSLKGVARSWVSEPGTRYAKVALNPHKLIAYGIDIESIIQVLRKSKFNVDLGLLKNDAEGQFSVEVHQAIQSLDDIKELEIDTVAGQLIRLQDLGEISFEYESFDRQYIYDNDNVVAIAMWPEPDANVYQVSESFLQAVGTFFGSDAKVVILNHPNKFISESILYVLISILAGIFAAAIVVVIFYRKVTSAILIVITMPVSLGLTFFFMAILGLGVNIISLSALSVTIGTVVDGAVIVLDSCMRSSIPKERRLEYIAKSTGDVSPSILTGTLTSIVVFLPMRFTEPMASSVLSDLVMCAIIILLASLFVCLVLVPSLIVAFRLDVAPSQSLTGVDTKPSLDEPEGTIKSTYFQFFWDKPLSSIALTVGVYMGAILLIISITPKISTEVIAQPKAQLIDIHLSFNQEGTSRETKLSVVEPFINIVEDQLGEDLESMYMDLRRNDLYISIRLKSYRSFDRSFKLLKNFIKDNDHVSVSIEPWITTSLNVALQPDIELLINPNNESLGRDIAQDAQAFLESKSEVLRTKILPSSQTTKNIEVEIESSFLRNLNKDEHQEYLTNVERLVRYSASPRNLYKVDFSENGELPLKVMLISDDLNDRFSLPISIYGSDFYLNQVIKINETQIWREYFSKNGNLTNKIDIWLSNNSLDVRDQILSELESHLSDRYELEPLPITRSNIEKNITTSIESLSSAFLIAAFLTLLVIFFHYNSAILSFMVLSVSVFGILGAIISLYVFNSTLSLNSMLGMLIILGLSVNNAILMTDFYLKFRAMSFDVVSAVRMCVQRRIRALMVANLTTIVGMLPLAIGFGPGQDITKPLGLAVSGGLVVSTLLTLCILPVALIIFGKYIGNNKSESQSLALVEHETK